MTGKKCLTLFDQLATEIILDIFDYLSSNDIIYTFFYLNERINSILLQHPRFINNLETSKTNFDFWQTISPTIGPLIQQYLITTDDFSFPLHTFSNLKSIIISCPVPINHYQLNYILNSKQFHHLTSFQIKSEIYQTESKFDGLEKILFKDLFGNNNVIQIFQCASTLSLRALKNLHNLEINENLHSLSLKFDNIACAFYLLQYTPNLKSYYLILISFYDETHEGFDVSGIKLKKLSVTYQPNISIQQINQVNFLLITDFIKRFSSSLISLSLNLSQSSITKSNASYFNGIFLQEHLLEVMIQLKEFHLYASFEQSVDAKNVLSTFNNPFWYDHDWSIGTHENYIYTLPFHFDQLDGFIDFDHIESNNSTILHFPNTWHRIRTIGLLVRSFHLIKQIELKMPNLTSITLSFPPNEFDQYEMNQTEIKLNHITTVHCEGQFIENLERYLVCVFPNVNHVVLSYHVSGDTNVSYITQFLKKPERYYRREKMKESAYFSNIENVETKFLLRTPHDFPKHMLRLVVEILAIFKNSKTFIFHFYQMNPFPLNVLSTNLMKIFTSLNTKRDLKNYQINLIDNCIRLTKKE